MRILIPMVAIVCLAMTLASCKSDNVGSGWPYNGPPMVGTNTIPVPKW